MIKDKYFQLHIFPLAGNRLSTVPRKDLQELLVRVACTFICPSSTVTNVSFRGLFSTASATLLLSVYNTNILHINKPNVAVGMALFTGGLGQFLAGMWEFPRGNMFGATGRCSTSNYTFPEHPACHNAFPANGKKYFMPYTCLQNFYITLPTQLIFL